jgi:hypothetical protein
MAGLPLNHQKENKPLEDDINQLPKNNEYENQNYPPHLATALRVRYLFFVQERC